MRIVKIESCASMDIIPQNVQYLDAMVIAEKLKFNLTIPKDNAELPEKKFRITRKAFAIACYTNVTKEDIMQHIQKEFDKLIQYICISSPSHKSEASSTSRPPRMFIQIILRKTVNKKTCFLQAVAGRKCNYRVTYDDRSWNLFLTKVGHYIEDGIFKSVSSRTGTMWSKNLPGKHTENKQISINHPRNPVMQSRQTPINATETILNKVKASIQEAINPTSQQIPNEYEYQRNNLLNRLTILYCMAAAPLDQ